MGGPNRSLSTADHTALAVGGFCFGVLQYTGSEKARIAQSSIENERIKDAQQKEFQKQFWIKQLETYTDAANLASQIANTQDRAGAAPLYQKLTDIYHGRMVLYGDPEVIDALRRFVQVYIEYEHRPGLQNDAKHAARAFAHACRLSSEKTWNVHLGKTDVSQL